MKVIRNWVLALTVGSAAILGSETSGAHAAGLWDQIESSGTLRCGAMMHSIPGSFKVNTPAKFEGYVINICRQIAEDLSKEMGKPITAQFIETNWNTVVLDLQSGRFDIWPGMGDTPERRKAINMAGPIYEVSNCFVNKRGVKGLLTWADYNKPEVRIAAVTGTTDEQSAKVATPDAQLLSFRDFSAATLAVQSGRADAFINSVLSCLDILHKNPEIFGEMVIPTPIRGRPSSAGLAKDEGERFTKWLNAWAADARASGKIKELFMDALTKAGLDPSRLPAGFAL